jgi:S-DNA-T family DNA segregation ATPase FtsK/SpoIIIE
MTGFGKSSLINLIMTHLIKNNKPTEVQFILFDMKMGKEFKKYKDIPHLRYPVAMTSDACMSLLPKVFKEYEDREQQIVDSGFSNWDEWKERDPENAIPYLIVVLDEAGVMIGRNKKNNEPLITDLIKLCRSAGMSCILADQYPKSDTLSTNITSQCGGRFAFHLETEESSKVVLGSTGAELLDRKGQCIFKNIVRRFKIQTTECKTDYISRVVQSVMPKQQRSKEEQKIIITSVLDLSKKGLSNTDIANQCGISEKIVIGILQWRDNKRK